MKKVLVGMSGGVDSSAAAALLIDKGYEVQGVTLRLFNDASHTEGRTCCSLEDIEDARRVCYKLGIEHYTFGFDKEFKENVIDYFIKSYVNGETPNPCIECNRHVKFSKMLERAQLMGCDYIATGHYAVIAFDEKSGRYLLKKAKDKKKDQTYMLYGLTQFQLEHLLLPLGDMVKSEIREYAQERGLINARKPDSQDICFVPDGDYAGFLKEKGGVVPKKGRFINALGETLGEHDGIINYTVGQRKGLGISFGEPMYVLQKNADDDTVTLGRNDELFSNEIIVKDCNFISIAALKDEMRVTAKTRYSQNEAAATIYPVGNKIKAVFDKPQRAIAKGQAAVFYDGDIVVGGGTIE